MKRDFREEYEEYMKKETPDLWGRIEKELTTEIPETAAPVKKSRKIVYLWRIAAAAAAVCAAFVGIGVLRLQRTGEQTSEKQVEQTANSSQPAQTANSAQPAQTANSSQPANSAQAADSTKSAPLPIMQKSLEEAPASEEPMEELSDALAGETANYTLEAEIPRIQYNRISSTDTDHGYGETYAETETSGFSLTTVNPLSTFSADVDTASYSNVRRMIEDGYGLDWIDAYAVRPEEFINYFSYDLTEPEDGEKFGVTTKVCICPWNEKHQLLFVGMKTEDIDLSEAPAENLTFLLDVSGSMDSPDKLPLLQKAFLQLADQLDEEDTVSIVTYANGVEVVLDSVNGNDKKTIRNAINNLEAAGGTYGEGGIQKAYELAEQNYRPDANNRIILATDGDLNIGISEPDQLEKFIREKKDKGIGLSVLGFGTGNIRDDNMERLADCGNGNYAYIDSILEAKKVMVEEMGASFHTVAEDVKLQVEFNPALVNAYRLIGYENRLMDAVDFRNDQKDAGEIGAGHSVVALYELIPADSQEAVELKYQGNADDDPAAAEYCTVAVRYKEPGETKAREVSFVVGREDELSKPDEDLTFVSAVAELAMILCDDPNKGTSTLEGILETGKSCKTEDEYRQEFFYMVRLLLKNS